MSAIEDRIDRVASEDGGNLLLDKQKNQSRLQEAGPNHRWSRRFGDRNRARSARLKVVRYTTGTLLISLDALSGPRQIWARSRLHLSFRSDQRTSVRRRYLLPGPRLRVAIYFRLSCLRRESHGDKKGAGQKIGE
jgi:hypothetical protein